ncbi:MAG: Crp/Fnr family transcriptional regulator [Alkalispirochaeta sp.]
MPDFFGDLAPRSLELLQEVEGRRTVAAGAMLFLEGEEGTTVYRLLSGSIRLFRSTPDGREVTIHMVETGDLFAEIVLFERDTYPVSAVAMENSLVAVIHRDRIRRLMADEGFREDFLKNLVGKMRFLSQQLYVLTTMDVRERLIRFLDVRYGRRPRITSELSKKDTAAVISVRPETLSRTLAQLEGENLVVWKGSQITVDPTVWDVEP